MEKWLLSKLKQGKSTYSEPKHPVVTESKKMFNGQICDNLAARYKMTYEREYY